MWLSEVMLQQTTVAAVAPYYARFLARWPTVEALAAASLDDVLAEWAGLGYYARARSLYACACQIAARGGDFPSTEEELLALPGIGPYTAGAIAAIAFGRQAMAIDANAERVLARLFGIRTPFPEAKTELKARALDLVPEDRAGDFAQALMDLGATICTLKRPACVLCPWTDACVARASGIAENLPLKMPKPERPTRRGAAFVLSRGDGAILLQRRPPKGLLGGMLEVPSTPWIEGVAPKRAAALAQAPATVDWSKRAVSPIPSRTFTWSSMFIRGAVKAPSAAVGGTSPVNGEDLFGRMCRRSTNSRLPTVMRKVIAAGLDAD